ncbi:MAG: hypothetical protein FWD58_07925 [Firmicutes bacterium]|nr:hypothetical protein [Bacillota bacterium]
MSKKWDAKEFRDHLKKHHVEYVPVFYSGKTYDKDSKQTIKAQVKATDYVKEYNACRGEGEKPAKTVCILVSDAKFDINDEKIDWDKASKIFAEQSSGTPHMFLGETIYKDSTYFKEERNAIINNDKMPDKVACFNLLQPYGSKGELCDKRDLPSVQRQKSQRQKDNELVKKIVGLDKEIDNLDKDINSNKLSEQQRQKLQEIMIKKEYERKETWDKITNRAEREKEKIVAKVEKAQSAARKRAERVRERAEQKELKKQGRSR